MLLLDYTELECNSMCMLCNRCSSVRGMWQRMAASYERVKGQPTQRTLRELCAIGRSSRNKE